MKAIILNSGIGKRIGELSNNKPKCLLEIAGSETILSRQLKILIDNGISDICLTTGYQQEELKNYLGKNFHSLGIKYVHNPKYDSTNYIYSLYLAKDVGDEDIMLMHGDMVFEKKLFKSLLSSDKKNAALIRRTKSPLDKDFKGRIEQKKVIEIGVDISGEDSYPLLPVYKLSNEFYRLWMEEIDRFVSRGKADIYAEDALNKILPQLRLEPVYFDKELCMKIDNPSDFEIVRELLKKEMYR